jgi:acetyl-CoA/propionyl-CoA carboxylase biotin carboxyl carrier protein
MRDRIGKIAVDAARAVDYRGAGTVEGLLADGEYFFLEMNTRVQVEHCVTELTTGIDIVKTGIRVAAGEALPFGQDDVVLRGHAIECRINAENAAKNFSPAPGRIGAYREPSGPGVRVDSGVGPGDEVSPMYDPMVAKLIVWDRDREEATRRMLRALGQYEIEGLTTLLPFHAALLGTEQWARGETCRDLLEDRGWLRSIGQAGARAGDAGAGNGADEGEEPKVTREYTVEVSGRRFDVRVIGAPAGAGAEDGARPTASGDTRRKPPRRARPSDGARSAGGGDQLRSPMQGTVLRIAVEQGATVDAGALVAIIEAMKMENEVTAHKAGTISELPISVGASVASGDTLAVIESA